MITLISKCCSRNNEISHGLENIIYSFFILLYTTHKICQYKNDLLTCNSIVVIDVHILLFSNSANIRQRDLSAKMFAAKKQEAFILFIFVLPITVRHVGQFEISLYIMLEQSRSSGVENQRRMKFRHLKHNYPIQSFFQVLTFWSTFKYGTFHVPNHGQTECK